MANAFKNLVDRYFDAAVQAASDSNKNDDGAKASDRAGKRTPATGFCFVGPRRRRYTAATAHASGLVAEWSCSGLQIRVRRFNSDPGLQTRTPGSRRGFLRGGKPGMPGAGVEPA